MSEIIVANVKSGAAGEYIGRVMRGRQGSVLGNPFKINKESARSEAIENYAQWMRDRFNDANSVQLIEMARLERILKRDGRLVLLCWCAPLPCHGQVIAEYLTCKMNLDQTQPVTTYRMSADGK